MAADERPVERLRGRAERQVVRRGTGSEHRGIVLETAGGERLTLVRLGGNPFADPRTEALAGHDVEVEGYRLGGELRYITATILA